MDKTFSCFLKLLGGSICFVVLAYTLASCGTNTEPVPTEETTELPVEVTVDHEPDTSITDFTATSPDIHEEIKPWPYEDGEEAGNPYYKRMVNENGDLIYAVVRASDGEVVELPMGITVLYASNDQNCYYERTYHKYKLNGKETETMQYQLYVTAIVPVGASDDRLQDPLAEMVDSKES